MNIFFLDYDPRKAAQYHADKHVVKMIVETAQLLSTAHCVLDGFQYTTTNLKTGKKRKVWGFGPGDERTTKIYQATHINHPCAVWVRQSKEHYEWTFELLCALLSEYTIRYKKWHKTNDLMPYLVKYPKNLKGNGWTKPALAMPDDCKVFINYKSDGYDPVVSYRKYYKMYKKDIAKWKHSLTPNWFNM